MAEEDGGGTGFSIDLDGDDGFDLDAMLSEQERIDAEAAGGGGTPPGGKKAAAAAGDDDDNPVIKANKLIIEAQNAEIARLQEQATRRFSTELPAEPAQPVQPAFDVAKLKDELAQQMIADPGGAALRIYEAAVKSAEQLVEARYRSTGTGIASVDIDAYRAGKMSDPAFKDSIQEFDDLVKQAAPGMTNLTAEQRRTQLDFLADTAFGRAERKRQAAGHRQRAVPPYSGGESVAGGTPRTTQYKGKPLNSVQQEVMRQAREAGITDPKRIKKMLDESED